MITLGIETSCDETSVALLKEDEVLINLISSQDIHNLYGGVVPELSSRAHLQIIMPLLNKALSDTNINLKEIDLITATAGPGLIGALLVGLTFAKGLAYSTDKPLVPVNHIEGHIFSGFLVNPKPEFPYLCLVVSGGHTLLLLVESDIAIKKIGTTIDDAAGEAFDKVSKLLGLGYPGGPLIQKAAEGQEHNLTEFPIAQTKNEFDFSFSGLKTSVLRFVQKEYNSSENIPIEDQKKIAASFQYAAIKALVLNCKRALNKYPVKSISIVGGVAANKLLKDEMEILAKRFKVSFVVPSLEYCGDNAAMIAYRGRKINQSGKRYDYSFNAFPKLKDHTFISSF
ncbi:MAG: tRNA (adenosine(37)-N6)-threonylcarbamoyltransferase complex transferase subunit TsaD [Melioribacteraceae bacterium]|nr:tRNA (adenosine(37)-N6)-threonylcarbamoyltransferase complex transferase subunit TsaD [Melioribacteraceae bacterium]